MYVLLTFVIVRYLLDSFLIQISYSQSTSEFFLSIKQAGVNRQTVEGNENVTRGQRLKTISEIVIIIAILLNTWQ